MCVCVCVCVCVLRDRGGMGGEGTACVGVEIVR